MLNAKNYIPAWLVAMGALLITELFGSIPLWIWFFAVPVSLVPLILGSIHLALGFYLPVVYKGDPSVNKIALTFDDGPDSVYTREVLSVLARFNCPAVFFIVGSRAESNPNLIRQILDEGHAIGCHSYSHHYLFDFFSSRRMAAELELTRKIVESISGKKLRLFRPPFGVTNPPLARAVRFSRFAVVGWSVRSNDTAIKDPVKIANRLIQLVKPGDIILLHDNRNYSADTLLQFIPMCLQKGMQFVRADRLLKTEAYEAN